MPWRYVRILTNFTCITTYNIDREPSIYPGEVFFLIEKPSGFFQRVFYVRLAKTGRSNIGPE